MVRKSTRLNKKNDVAKEQVDESSSDSDVEACAAEVSERMMKSLAAMSETDSDSSDSTGGSTLQFVIDKTGGRSTDVTSSSQSSYSSVRTPVGCVDDDISSSDSDEYFDESDDCDKSGHQQRNTTDSQNDRLQLSSKLEADLDPKSVAYLNTDIFAPPELRNKKLEEMLLKPKKGEELMKKSVLTSDFEKNIEIKPYQEGVRQARKQRQLERSKTKGSNWYDMRAPEMTEEQKNDLSILQMRRSLDPKRFYKGPDMKATPKFFQMGTIIEAPADFYHSRVPKKQRKSTLVDELLEDAEFRRYNKRKYSEIQELKRKKGHGAHKQAKRWKKKKK